MPNSYFRFKQFTIHQDRCAMKVGTDGVLLGAWVDVADAERILDIGTGTGLIALMLAQRAPQAHIDAVELDAEASQQAQENVARSPWADRVQVHQADIRAYAETCPQGYNLIVSNPPFFEAGSKAATAARTLARHSDTLSLASLLQAARACLRPQGRLALIYPASQSPALIRHAETLGLFCQETRHIRPKAHLPVKRHILIFSKHTDKTRPCQHHYLLIEKAQRYVYTPDFINLVRDFYLKY